MENCKYIVVNIFCGPVGMKMKMETPILFPAHVGHIDMARSLGIAPDDVLAAGFVEIYPLRKYRIKVKATGESTSLGIPSREEDSDLIRRVLNIDEPGDG
jgi:hypothetical protein